MLEKMRLYDQANKEKIAERKRLYRQANKEKLYQQEYRYREANKEKMTKRKNQHYKANKDKLSEKGSRINRKIRFAKEDGSSFQAWLASLYNPNKVFQAIANLQPDPGQTLAELIHELSGYAMEVCQQIANPPVIQDAPPAEPTPQPDLF